jgi:serine O-acetyltransferase
VPQFGLTLRAGNVLSLARYVATQLNNMFPAGGMESDVDQVMAVLPAALERLLPITFAVRSYEPGFFNHFHTLQYATLLYLLGNEQWQTEPTSGLADRLFCLNRSLNSIDLFHAVKMPEVFFISHGLGTVLGNAIYGTRLVVFQNVTVGRVGEDKPVVGQNVVLYPGAIVTGSAVIGENSVISAGTVVHGTRVPENTIATGRGRKLVFQPRKRDYAALYFRTHS